jgi:fibronectin-binding autotransporter adhesin
LILTGVNTYTGNTTIGSGSTLQIGGASSLGSGSYAGNITDNGTFEYSSSAAQTLSGVISGAGALAQNGTGTLILTGANTYAGGTFLDAGTLGIDSNGDLGAGPLIMQPGTTLRFEASGLNLSNTIVLRNADPTIDTGANTDTISGVISGPGSLAKIGSGTLILSAANIYAGATDVQAGTLAVTGSIVSSATVESGATLGGSGTIGGLVAKSGTTIAPGVLAPFSTLTVNGAASFAAGSIFAVSVNAAGQNDKLVTTGATTISGGTVQVTPAPGTYAPQTRYTLITAGGGVSGTFSALTGLSSLAFLSPALGYDADDVFLGFSVKTAPPSTPLFASIAQTPNQSGIALALQAQPPGSPLFDAIIGQTVTGAVAAFDALSGEVHASAVSAAFDDQRLPREAVFDRLATPYGGALAGGAQSVQTLAAPNPAQVFAAWGQAFDSWGHIGGDGNAATLSNNLGGLIFGADATLQGRYRLGVAGGYDYSTLGLGARSSSGNVSTTYVGLYGGLSDGALQLRGGGFYGYNHYGTNRIAVFPGFADALSSGYGGDTWQAFAEAGWRMPVGGLAAYSAWAEPFVGLTGLEIATRSFGESAGAAALNGASATYDYGITTLGLRGEASLFVWAPLVANGMIGWQNVFGDVTPNSVLAFASAPSVPFAIAGAPIARNALAVEAGADWRFTANVKLGIYYSGLIASNASDNAIKVKLEANF